MLLARVSPPDLLPSGNLQQTGHEQWGGASRSLPSRVSPVSGGKGSSLPLWHLVVCVTAQRVLNPVAAGTVQRAEPPLCSGLLGRALP